MRHHIGSSNILCGALRGSDKRENYNCVAVRRTTQLSSSSLRLPFARLAIGRCGTWRIEVAIQYEREEADMQVMIKPLCMLEGWLQARIAFRECARNLNKTGREDLPCLVHQMEQRQSLFSTGLRLAKPVEACARRVGGKLAQGGHRLSSKSGYDALPMN